VGRLIAVVASRCPRCLKGRVWRGPFRINQVCPVCGLLFEREQGYWTGAMVASYALGVPLLAAMLFGVWVATRWAVTAVLITADALFIAAAPFVWRYSRVVWLHLDWLLDPIHG